MMRRWVGYVAIGALALVVLGAAGIYAGSVLRLARKYESPVHDFNAMAFGIPPAEARRRAESMMCTDCHQKGGQILFEADGVGRIVAPNLTRVARTYSDGELERLIRKGIKRDGTAAMIMPAKTYARLADEDVAAVITWLRGMAEIPDAVPDGTRWGPLGRIALATNKVAFEADDLPSFVPTKTRPADVGRYLVDVACTHCHRLKTDNDNGFGMKTPPLATMVQSYSYDQFVTLLNMGKPIGGREMPFMSKVAREAFAFYTDAETRAIYDYLTRVR